MTHIPVQHPYPISPSSTHPLPSPNLPSTHPIPSQAAVRSVDPTVTLPYWDFTIEGQTIRSVSDSDSDLDSEEYNTVDSFLKV